MREEKKGFINSFKGKGKKKGEAFIPEGRSTFEGDVHADGVGERSIFPTRGRKGREKEASSSCLEASTKVESQGSYFYTEPQKRNREKEKGVRLFIFLKPRGEGKERAAARRPPVPARGE